MRRRRTDQDEGYATAEAALALPALLAVLALCLWVVACVAAELRCVDAARVAARVAARGDSDADAVRAGATAAPAGAGIRLDHSPEQVTVVVQVRVKPFGAAAVLGAVTVHARAVAEREDAP